MTIKDDWEKEMNELNDDYEDRIFKVRGEFIYDLKKSLTVGSDRVDIRNVVYKFVFDRVVGLDMVGVKEKRKLFFNFFIKTVDFCLSYGFVLIDVLSKITKESQLKVVKESEEVIDA